MSPDLIYRFKGFISKQWKYIFSVRSKVLHLLEQENFVDPWRLMPDNEQKYTWRRLNPAKKQARLDYFLIHESVFQYVTDSDIIGQTILQSS